MRYTGDTETAYALGWAHRRGRIGAAKLPALTRCANELGTADLNSRSLVYHRNRTATRAWRNGIRSGLKENLSARRETGDVELPKFGEPCNGNPEPSLTENSRWEGVETRRAAPKPQSAGKR